MRAEGGAPTCCHRTGWWHEGEVMMGRGCACVRGDWIDQIPIPPQQNTSLGQERELSTWREVAPPLILIYASL
jgi:hypothetical protein